MNSWLIWCDLNYEQGALENYLVTIVFPSEEYSK